MPMPMTEEQAFAHISSPFHPEFKQLQQTYLQPEENIFAADNCSVDDFFGFFIITTYRAILVCCRADQKRQRIRYYKEGGGFFSSTVPDERFWFAPFSTPLSQSELKTRVAQDVLLSSIVRVERKEYSVISGGQQLRIVELDYQGSGRGPDGRVGSVGLWHTAFNAEDGQTIYNLIQTAIQSGGRINPKAKVTKQSRNWNG